MVKIEANDFNKVVALKDRTREICMVVKKGNTVLLVTKDSYADPQNMYRLPTGGVKNGETDSDTLSRELKEEFNQSLNLLSDLGTIEFVLSSTEGQGKFWTHIYLVEPTSEIILESDHEHSGHIWVDICDLTTYIKKLEHINPQLNTKHTEWSSWGKLRAETLKYVYTKLLSE